MGKRPSVEFLRECFDYREGDLYWKVRPVEHFMKPADQGYGRTAAAIRKEPQP